MYPSYPEGIHPEGTSKAWRTMKPSLHDNRGIALALAIVSLVVMGALVAGALFIGTQEQRMGANQYRVQQAFSLAEAGGAEVIRIWDPDSFNVKRVFPADTYHLGTRVLPSNTGTFGGSVFKLNRI